MSKFDVSPFIKAANAILRMRNQNPDALMKIYREFTCEMIGKNKGEVQLSMVRKNIFGDKFRKLFFPHRKQFELSTISCHQL